MACALLCGGPELLGALWGLADATSAIPYPLVPASCHPPQTTDRGARPETAVLDTERRRVPQCPAVALASLRIYTVKTVLDYLTKGLSEGVTFTLPGTESAGKKVAVSRSAQYVVLAERENLAQPPLEVCPSSSSTKRGSGRSQGTWAHPAGPL